MKIHRLPVISPKRGTDPGELGIPAHRQITYTKLGEQRGKPRLWMEGVRLEACGFAPGVAYRVDLDLVNRQVRLKIDPQGDRAVSSRKQRNGESRTPIVDITGGALSEVLGEGARVRAILAAGEIVFDLHPVERAVEAREKRTREHLAQGFLTESALCAGAGISTLALQRGLESAGLVTRVDWVIDRDGRYLDLAVANNPAITSDTRIYESTLEEIETAALNETDCLQVSLPCTGHSTAGKSKRKLKQAEDHPTDALAVFGLMRILEAVNPTVVVSENVKSARDSASYALVRAYLADQGYVLFEGVLNAEQAGSIENRDRWWLVGLSRGFAEGFSMDHVPDMPREFERVGDVLDALADDDSRWRAYDYLQAKAVRDAAAGKGFKRQLVGPNDTRVGTLSRGYFKARSTDPFLVREDGLQRLFTPGEHARLKGIPDGLVAGTSETVAHEVLGQSILFGHAEGIGVAVGKQLKGVLGAESQDPDVERGDGLKLSP